MYFLPYCTALPYGADVLLDTPIERSQADSEGGSAGRASVLGYGVNPKLRDFASCSQGELSSRSQGPTLEL